MVTSHESDVFLKDGMALDAADPSGAPKLAVAFSGGADSTALLLEMHEKHPRQVLAFHVDHALQAAASQFVAHCQKFCLELKIPFYVAQVNAHAKPRQSPEDAARIARYEALARLAKTHGVLPGLGKVLLAQHADDQLETFFLALNRGSGLAGLSAMPRQFERHGVLFERPFLERSSQEIRRQLQSRGVAYINDPSNADKRFTRNKIRLDAMPSLLEAFPQLLGSAARSMAHIAQAQTLLLQLAQMDLQQVGSPPRILALQVLPPERQVNALRAWLRQAHQVVPSTAQMQELLRQIQAHRTRGHRIRLKVALGFVEHATGGAEDPIEAVQHDHVGKAGAFDVLAHRVLRYVPNP